MSDTDDEVFDLRQSVKSLVGAAFHKERMRCREYGLDEPKSLDRFLYAVGGDSARRTYYRILAENEVVEPIARVREGAFHGMVATALKDRVDDYKLGQLIMNFQLNRHLYDQMHPTPSARRRLEEALGVFLTANNGKWPETNGLFRAMLEDSTYRLVTKNQHEEALSISESIQFGLFRNIPRYTAANNDFVIEFYRDLCLSGGLLCAEMGKGISYFGFQNDLTFVAAHHPNSKIHFNYLQSLGRFEWACLMNKGRLWLRTKGHSFDAIAAPTARWCLNSANKEAKQRSRSALSILSECAYALGYSRLPIYLRTTPGSEESSNLFASRQAELLEALECAESKPAGNGNLQFQVWLALGHMLACEGDKTSCGITVWNCLEKMRDILRIQNSIDRAKWLEWYELCARALQASGDDTSASIASHHARAIIQHHHIERVRLDRQFPEDYADVDVPSPPTTMRLGSLLASPPVCLPVKSRPYSKRVK